MRRIICLMLVLVLCVSMTGVAFASAVKSPGQGGEAPSVPEGGDKPTAPEGGGEVDPTTPDQEESTTPTVPGGEEPPKTGDRSAVGLWLLLMLLALVAMVVILVLDYKYMRR